MFRKKMEFTMFTTNLDNFKTNQKELHRQAAEYRLVRSVENPRFWASKIYSAVGRTLISSGQELIKQAQATQ